LIIGRYDSVHFPCVDPALFEQDSNRRRTGAFQKSTRNDQALVDGNLERCERRAEHLLTLHALGIARITANECESSACVHLHQVRNRRREPRA